MLRDKLFTQGTQRAALVGLGGVGKTQVALELAYWTKRNKPGHSIFWVPALSFATFEQAYVEIARKLLLVQGKSEDDDPKESVQRYLSSEAAGRWLLIVDNADDMDVFAGSRDTPGGIRKYLPESETGLVLFTTRSRDIALLVADGDMVKLHQMHPQQATSVLERSLSQKDLMKDDAAVRELLDELTCLPLAITQAAAYLNRNQVSIAVYLRLLRGAEEDMVSLISREFHDNMRYMGSQNAVATTWLVSFDQIRKFDPPAAELLSFISYIEPKAIPQSILPVLKSNEQMVHALGTLCGYAFLGRRDQDDMFDMHSLVHVATRIWIEKHQLKQETETKAVQHLSTTFPSPAADRELWRLYLPHALQLLHRTRECQTEDRYHLSFQVGRCLKRDRRFKESIRCFTEVYHWRKTLAEDNHSRLSSEHELATAYLEDRQIEKAINILEHVVAVRKKTQAEDDHFRLASEHELATAYLNDNRIKEATDILEHVVAVRKKIQAEDDHFQLASEHELASAYLDDRRIKEAIDILEHIVAVRKKTQAEDDHYRLASEHELARAYLNDNRIKEAIDILEHVVAVEKKTLAEDNYSRLVSEHELARAYLDDNRIKEAIDIFEYVVAVKRTTLAEDNHFRLVSEQYLMYALQVANQQRTKFFV